MTKTTLKTKRAPMENGTVILRYLPKSRQLMGQPYYDVVSPKLPHYNYGPDTGLPTFALSTLKEKGLIRQPATTAHKTTATLRAALEQAQIR